MCRFADADGMKSSETSYRRSLEQQDDNSIYTVKKVPRPVAPGEYVGPVCSGTTCGNERQGFTGALLHVQSCSCTLLVRAAANVRLHSLADAWCNTLQHALLLQGALHASATWPLDNHCYETFHLCDTAIS